MVPSQANPQPSIGRQRKQFSKTINKPTRLAAALESAAQPLNKDPTKNTVFVSSMSVREVSNDTRFSVSTPALIGIARACYNETCADDINIQKSLLPEYVDYYCVAMLWMYNEMCADDINIQKSLLPEYVDYYCVAMLWMRLMTLKVKLRQPITETERDTLLLIENSQFAIPEPLMIELRAIGRVQTMTREYLTPTIPDLPTSVSAGQDGYYGPINIDIHNVYEELPCLGVAGEAVRHAVGNEPVGPYASSLARPQPNQNLLGFRPLGNRRNEGIEEPCFRRQHHTRQHSSVFT